MNTNFNRQFVMTDFQLIGNPAFMKFVGARYAIYLVLRRHIWRSDKPHHMDLHKHYQNHKLTCSLDQGEIAKKAHLTSRRHVSKHLSAMVKEGILKTIRTGRGNVYVLGEWVDVSRKRGASKKPKKLEWFYFDRKFAVDPPDNNDELPSDGTLKSHLLSRVYSKTPSDETAESHHYNKGINREKINKKTVNRLKNLPEIEQPEEKTEYLTEEMVGEFGDPKSESFYNLVASRVPEPIIRETIADIRQSNAKEPAKLFTYRMIKYAAKKMQKLAVDKRRRRLGTRKGAIKSMEFT